MCKGELPTYRESKNSKVCLVRYPLLEREFTTHVHVETDC